DGEEPAALAELLPRLGELRVELADPGAQGSHLVLELEDALDAAEGDPLVLREALHLAQPGDVRGAVPAAATTSARGGDETHPVVLAQRLRVHAGELGGDGDDEDRGL